MRLFYEESRFCGMNHETLLLYQEIINDFLFQYIGTIEEAEWIVEIMKTSGLPTAITLCISEAGDFNNVPLAECSVRLAKTGKKFVSSEFKFGRPFSVV